MRCWTDGKRSAFFRKDTLDWHDGDVHVRVKGLGGRESAGPNDGLAVHPEKAVAWVSGDGAPTFRIDLATGEAQAVGHVFADLCFVGGDEIWAVSGLAKGVDRERRRLLRFRDGLEPEIEEIPLPAVRSVAWPYGPAYQYSAPPLPEDVEVVREIRMTSTAHGVCIASADGVVWGFPKDGEPFGWQISPVYQGWLVARLWEEGVVLTAVHNGRTGEVVLMDLEGRWYDSFDSQWHTLSPAVPAGDGVFLMGWDFNELYAIGGFPLETLGQEHLTNDWITDMEISADGACVVWMGATEYGTLTRAADGRWLGPSDLEDGEVLEDGEDSERFALKVGEALRRGKRWTWTRTVDAELGDLSPSIPDPERLRGLVQAVEEAEKSGGRALDFLDDVGWKAFSKPPVGDVVLEIYRRLMRETLSVAPTRAQIWALARRAADASRSEFERYHALDLLGVEVNRAAMPTRAEDVLVRARRSRDLAKIGERTFAVDEARLDGTLGPEGLRWCARFALVGGAALTVESSQIDVYAFARGSGAENPVEKPAAVSVNGKPGVDAWWSLTPDGLGEHRLWAQSQDGQVSVDCLIYFAGVFLRLADIDLARPGAGGLLAEATRRLARHIDIAGWFGEVTAEGVRLSPFAEDLREPVALEVPGLDAAVGQLIERLVAEELLLLEGTFGEEELWRLQWALFGGGTLAQCAERLDEELMRMDVVEELFGDREDLASVVAEILEG